MRRHHLPLEIQHMDVALAIRVVNDAVRAW